MSEQPKPENPLEKVFNEINNLLREAYSRAHLPQNPELPNDIEEKLSALEEQVEQLTKNADKLVAKSGTDWRLVEDLIKGEELNKVQPQHKELLEKALELKNEAEKAKMNFQSAAADALERGNVPGKKKKDDTAQSRKAKFKIVGGKKNWKPL
jgi:uncharacterized protein YoxC